MGVACLAGTLLAVRLATIAALLWAPCLARDLAAGWRERGGWIPGRLWRAAQGTLAPFERVLRPDWQDAAARARPDWKLLPRGSPLVAGAPLTGRWRLVCRDSLAAVLAPVPPPGPAR